MRALVVDDEPVARRRLVRLLGAHADVEVVAECAGGRDAVDTILAERPDVVFLDVQMPDLDGFGVLAALDADALPAVVFVTAYDQYALKAFDAHAVDYLLKPYEPARFDDALARVRQWLSAGAQAAGAERLRRLLASLPELQALQSLAGGAEPDGAAAGAGARRRLALRLDGRLRMVPTAQVDWLESDGNYVRVHVGRASHLVRNTLAAFESELDGQLFARIHRRFIVNLDRVAEVQPWFAGDSIVILHDGTKLRLSRTYREQFLSRFLGDR